MPNIQSVAGPDSVDKEGPPRITAGEAPLSPLSTPAPTDGDGRIRPLRPQDVGAVADLFQKHFRKGRGPAPEPLAAYLEELFLHHPCAEADLPSRVHLDPEGKVDGFIGVLPARMQFRGRALRAAIAGSLMVADPRRDPLAGARLLRAFLKGPQDLSISESANPLSQGMWERLGGFAAASYSLEWVRVLRPFSAGLAALAAARPSARRLRPFARGADRLCRPLAARFLALAPPGPFPGGDADDAQIADAVCEFSDDVALGPNWDTATLRWMLSHAQKKERHGTLFRRIVRARGGRLLGCYLYYGRPDGIAWVLQILGRREHLGAIVDDLLRHAAGQGCAAVRGRTNPQLLGVLLTRNCVMLHRASTVVHARDPRIVQAVLTGDAVLDGLAGESWTRLIGGEFR
ncbi:MAG TPA: hypothetical protein VFQ27_14265 [Xanthobacteraceae bacterium]|nr:hypothetical protein [Xanthobacteraceae bacterium]